MGLAIDVGPEMTAKIMKENGEIVKQSTYRGSKEEEKSNQDNISLGRNLITASETSLVRTFHQTNL